MPSWAVSSPISLRMRKLLQHSRSSVLSSPIRAVGVEDCDMAPQVQDGIAMLQMRYVELASVTVLSSAHLDPAMPLPQ